MNKAATQAQSTDKPADIEARKNTDIIKKDTLAKQSFYDFYLDEHQTWLVAVCTSQAVALAYWGWQSRSKLVHQNPYSKALQLDMLALGLVIFSLKKTSPPLLNFH